LTTCEGNEAAGYTYAGGTVLDQGGAFITYTSPAGFTGTDRIGYTIEEEPSAQSTRIVEVKVEAAK